MKNSLKQFVITSVVSYRYSQILIIMAGLVAFAVSTQQGVLAESPDRNAAAAKPSSYGPAARPCPGQSGDVRSLAGLAAIRGSSLADQAELAAISPRQYIQNLLAVAGAETWATLPLFGGEMTSIVQDPFNVNTVYVGTRDAGVFKTTDGGATWNPARQGLTFYPIRCLAADPLHPGTLYAGTDYDGVWKTTDGAATWFKSSQGLDEDLIVFNIIINPQDSSVLYAGLAGGTVLQVGNIYKSIDGGNTWQVKDSGLPRLSSSSNLTNGIFSLAIDPSNPLSLFAGTHYYGAFRTTDGGETWSAMNTGLPLMPNSDDRWWYCVNALATDPRHANRPAMAYENGGFYCFTEQGNWETVSKTGSFTAGIGPGRLFFHPTNANFVYSAAGGFYLSTNGGVDWDDRCPSVIDLAFHPSTPDTILGAREPNLVETGGVTKSTDQGQTWVEVSSGITAAIIRSVAVDPKDARNLYAGTGDGFFYFSHDGGTHWARGSYQLYETLYNFGEISDIAVDPNNPQNIYIGGIFGIFKSTDHGVTFQEIKTGFSAYSILVTHQTPSIIYAGGNGIHKSTDNGLTWTEKNQGLPLFGGRVSSILCLTCDPSDQNVIWAGTQFCGIVKSTTGGDQWEVMGLNQNQHNSIGAIAVHSTNGDEVLAGFVPFNGQIYKSTDGGKTWAVKISGLAPVQRIVYDPRNPKWVYAATEGSGVLRSMDSGETWYPFSDGIFYPLVYDIDITNETQSLLLTGSYASGLYEMRAPVPVMRYAFPRLSYKPGLANEGFGFVNTGSDPARVTFTAYDAAGTPVKNSGAITWPGGAQAAYQADGLLGLSADFDAWVLAESDQSTLRGFFLSEQLGGGLTGLDGAAVFDQPMTDGVAPAIKTTGAFTTELFVANPGSSSAIRVVFVGYDGAQAYDGGPRTIPARGFLKLDAAGLFSGARFDGYLRVVADGGFIGNATIRYGQASLASADFIPVSAAAETQYAAHVTRWPSLYYSELNLVNPSGQEVHPCVDTYYTIQGQTGTNHSWKFLDIPPYQVVTLKDKDLGLPDGKVSEGWIEVESGGGRVLGCVTFGRPTDNRYLSLLPLQAETETELWFAQVANGNVGGVNYFTGLAVVNPNRDADDVTVKVYASNGTLLGQAVLHLAAKEKYVNMLRQIPGLTGLPDQASGYIRVSSTQPVVSFVLFGDTALNFLSAVPAQH